MSIINYKNTIDILLSALLASKKAGDAILEVYKSDFAIEHKNDRSPLTLADKRSHQIIVDQLSTSPLNHFPVLSEEGRDIPYEERKSWEYFWLIDPLDGTKEFINRNSEFTVNIALIYKVRPVLGIIYVPLKDTFYFGAEGIGAYKLVMSDAVMSNQIKEIKESESLKYFDDLIKASEKLQIHENVSPITEHASRITVIGSRSHMSKETEDYINKLKEKHGEVAFIPAGSSLKFCFVAEGKADVYPRFGLTMEWDTAAGQVIVEQAGGKVIEFESNKPLEYNKRNLLNPWFVAKSKLIK